MTVNGILVTDVGQTMALWPDAAAAVRRRFPVTWELDLDSDGRDLRLFDNSGEVRDARRLRGGAVGAPLVLVTDAVGAFWSTSSARDLLAAWAAERPVLIAQVLPASMWHRTALPPIDADDRQPAEWVPLVALGAADWNAAHAVPIGRLPVGEADLPSEPVSARSRVAQFQATSSAAAFTLAADLAAAPLTLPLMQAVRRELHPGTNAGHLAEVLLSDLMVEAFPFDAPEYEFRAEVRAELLRTRSRRDVVTVLETLRELAAEVPTPFGSMDVWSLAATAGAQPLVDPGARAFAEVAALVLDGLGGRFGEMASRIRTSLAPAAARDHHPVDDAWDRLDRLVGEEPVDVLYAAMCDLDDLARRLPAPALPFTVGAADFSAGAALDVRIGPVQVRLDHRVLLAARDRKVSPLGLLAQAVVTPAALGRDRRPPPSRERSDDWRRVFRYTPAYDGVANALDQGQDVLLVGDHCSGRSALAANVALQRTNADRGVVWLELDDPADGPRSAVHALLRAERAADYLLLVDGLDEVAPVASCVRSLRDDFRLPVQLLATGPRSAAERWLTDLHEVTIDGRDTVRQMLDDAFDSGAADPEARADIEALVSGDVHLAAAAVELYRRTGVAPDRRILSVLLAGGVDDPGERTALYYLACLGSLGLTMARPEAEKTFGSAVERLYEYGFIHRTFLEFFIGPQRRAELVMRYAREEWPEQSRERPEDIAWSHLQRGGGRGIRNLLNRLEPDRGDGPVALWSSVERIATGLERMTDDDPTWGDSLDAAVFAAMALIKVRPDETERWVRIAAPIRARWQYLDPAARRPEPVSGARADLADFDEITEQMRIEDDHLAPLPHPSGMPAGTVDRDAAYRNWVLGLLLSLEGTAPAPHRDQARIDALVAMAGRAQEIDGSFHPARLPWLTARIVIGLSQAGPPAHASNVARNAGRWLVDGDPAWWRSGSGDWNSDEATTATALLALHAANLGHHPTAVDWLRHREDEWTRPDRESDRALAVEALALSDRRSVRHHLLPLLRQLQIDLVNPDLARRRRIPFVAFHVAGLAWQTVRAECHALLRNLLDVPAEPADRPSDLPFP